MTASHPELAAVMEAITQSRLPVDPLDRLMTLIERFRYSLGSDPDPLTATAHTPCWAINLAASARGDAFRLSGSPLPFPGIVQRVLFRADLESDERRGLAVGYLLDALYETALDIARLPRAADVFAMEFPDQRRNSRLHLAWMMLFALGTLTPAQLGRGISATKAGAGKLLRQLETQGFARSEGPMAPFACVRGIPLALPDWREVKAAD